MSLVYAAHSHPKSVQVQQGQTGVYQVQGVFLFSLVDTKEIITAVKAAACLQKMSRLIEGSIYKNVKYKKQYSSSDPARHQHAYVMNQ